MTAKEKCGICGNIGTAETGFAKYGWPDQTILLPSERGKLTEIVSCISSRGDALYQCPECSACFHYNLDYEYLAGGSEDTETLTRISDSDAQVLKEKIRQMRKSWGLE